MNDRLHLLAARRAILVAESGMQRQALIDECARWEAPLQRVERGLAGLAWARRHLGWLLTAGAALAVSPTARGWLLRGWQVWRAVRQMQIARRA